MVFLKNLQIVRRHRYYQERKELPEARTRIIIGQNLFDVGKGWTQPSCLGWGFWETAKFGDVEWLRM